MVACLVAHRCSTTLSLSGRPKSVKCCNAGMSKRLLTVLAKTALNGPVRPATPVHRRMMSSKSLETTPVKSKNAPYFLLPMLRSNSLHEMLFEYSVGLRSVPRVVEQQRATKEFCGALKDHGFGHNGHKEGDAATTGGVGDLHCNAARDRGEKDQLGEWCMACDRLQCVLFATVLYVPKPAGVALISAVLVCYMVVIGARMVRGEYAAFTTIMRMDGACLYCLGVIK